MQRSATLPVDHSLTTLETSAVSGTILPWMRWPLSGLYSKIFRRSPITGLEEPQPIALRHWATVSQPQDKPSGPPGQIPLWSVFDRKRTGANIKCNPCSCSTSADEKDLKNPHLSLRCAVNTMNKEQLSRTMMAQRPAGPATPRGSLRKGCLKEVKIVPQDFSCDWGSLIKWHNIN